jgi:hypothetical protein
VNALRRMINRHYQRPHRLTVITDDAEGIDAEVRIIPLWDTFANLPSPYGAHAPSCYRRIPLFGPDAAKLIGPRFLCLDLDVVAVADLTPLWDRPESFVGLRDPLHPRQLNGSMWLLTAGARPQVWDSFDPQTSPARARAAGFRGSDQAWLSYCLPGEATWGPEDGVYSFRKDIEPKGGKLPEDARLIIFHGQTDPWDARAQALPWVRECYGAALTPH